MTTPIITQPTHTPSPSQTLTGGGVGGSFSLKFNALYEFTRFNRFFRRVYANAGAHIEFDAPLPTGPLSYQIRFYSTIGCDTALRDFKLGYDRTFRRDSCVPSDALGEDYVPKTAYSLEVHDADFTATLLTCTPDTLTLTARDRALRQFEHAMQVFEAGDALNSNYVDKDGLVQFIVATQYNDNDQVLEALIQRKDELMAMTSIVTAAMNQLSIDDPALKHNIQKWSEVIGHLPLMGPSKVESQTYKRRLVGVEIATSFIEFIMGLAVTDGAAVAGFKDFLSKQGDAIRIGVENNADKYSVISSCVVSEVIDLNGHPVFVPKLKTYYIDFSRENWKVTSSCASAEYVEIEFEYQEATSVFDYKALEDPAVKSQWDAFVSSRRKADIEDADTFFGDIFKEAPSRDQCG